jgi:hypothetical protein
LYDVNTGRDTNESIHLPAFLLKRGNDEFRFPARLTNHENRVKRD